MSATVKPPNPGSAEAIRMGCKCPVFDNHYGEGFETATGDRVFWISEECPLHTILYLGDSMPDT